MCWQCDYAKEHKVHKWGCVNCRHRKKTSDIPNEVNKGKWEEMSKHEFYQDCSMKVYPNKDIIL